MPSDQHARPLRLLAGQVVYQNRMLARSRVGVFFVFVLPLMLLLALALLNDNRTLPLRGGIDFTQFVAPAVIAFVVLNICYANTITSAALAREEGILKRLRGTPLPPWIYVAGRVLSALTLSAAAAIAVVALGAGVYDVEVVVAGLPAAVLTIVVGVASFTALGYAVAARVPTADAAFPVAWGTLLPLCFVSDIFIPLDRGPDWLQTAASAFPVKPFANALENAFNPTLGHAPSWGLLAVVLAWGLGAALLAPRVFRWEPGARRWRRRLPA